MTEATQRPWAVMQNDYAIPGIVSADGEYVVEEVANNADMNADLIVKAVNSHDALVAALKLTLQYAKENADIREIEVMVEAALEQVK
tara:strand:- start:433 stop:693 length:261 start_codon:yes stop_codon:yes gene_type:complete